MCSINIRQCLRLVCYNNAKRMWRKIYPLRNNGRQAGIYRELFHYKKRNVKKKKKKKRNLSFQFYLKIYTTVQMISEHWLFSLFNKLPSAKRLRQIVTKSGKFLKTLTFGIGFFEILKIVLLSGLFNKSKHNNYLIMFL